MPWGSRRAAALVKSGGSRSSLAVAVASLSVTEPSSGRARRARGEQSPGRRRAEPGWEQSRAGRSSQPRARRPGAARTPQYHTARHAAAPPACDRRSCALALALALTLTLTHANV